MELINDLGLNFLKASNIEINNFSEINIRDTSFISKFFKKGREY